MDDLGDTRPTYSMLQLVVRHGRPASLGLAIGVLALALACALAAESILMGVIGAVLAGLAYVLARIVVELVGLITDMLLPQ